MRRVRPLLWLAAASFVGAAAVPFLPAPAHADDAPAGLLTADAEAYAARIEYDIPLPAGSGTIAHVVGSVGRSSGGENAKALAGAPSELDAVVGGSVADPARSGKPINHLPQTECFYPGALLSTVFRFPTEVNPSAAAVPPTTTAAATCSAGPQALAHAKDGDIGGKGTPSEGLAPAADGGSATSDLDIHPAKGVLTSSAAARASGLSFLGGALKIGSVEVSGESHVTGKKGGQGTLARVSLNDVSVGGVTFSIADDRLLVAGQSLPLDSAAAQTTFDSINLALEPLACNVNAITSPDRFPKGYLLANPDPALGVKEDGTYAASMKGGLVVLCDPPSTLTGPTGFSPQRLQMVIGFVYSGAGATEDPGGFSLGDLGGAGGNTGPGLPAVTPPGAGRPSGGGSAVLPSTGGGLPAAETPKAGLPSTDAGPGASLGTGATAAPTAKAQPIAALRFPPMSPKSRWLLGLLSLGVWAILTHFGAQWLFGAGLAAVRCGPSEDPSDGDSALPEGAVR